MSGELVGRACDRVEYLAQVAADAGAAVVRVDASSVTFAGSDGVRSLLAARRSVEDAGGIFELLEPSRPLVRILVVLGLADFFEVTSTSTSTPA